MDQEMFDLLNHIYLSLNERAAALRQAFERAGYAVTDRGFFHHHVIRQDQAFVTEHYPIPVFSVKGIGDVGIDLSFTWVELMLPKEKAILIDYPAVSRSFSLEVYGRDHYCDDFYTPQLNPHETVEKLLHSQETVIHLCFSFDKATDVDEIQRALRQFAG